MMQIKRIAHVVLRQSACYGTSKETRMISRSR